MLEESEFNLWGDAEKMANIAFELYERGQMNMALAQLTEAIEINPNNSAWHFNAGLTLDALERFEDAIAAYKEALALSPDDPEILNCLAVDYTRTCQYDLSIATFEHVQSLDASFEPCYCNRIITYTEMDLHEQAEHMFYLAQQINPDCPICFYNIGNSLFTRQQFEKAIWCWQKTAELDPDHPQIHYRIAQAHWAQGNFHLAKSHFLRQLRTDPGEIDIILDFGIFLLKTSEFDAAKEKFNRIIELDPNFSPALFYLGELALSQRDSKTAADFFTKAIDRDPTAAGPRYRLAELALRKKDTQKALAYLKTEAELDIADTDVLVSMASIFAKLDELDDAVNCLLRAIDEDNTNADAFHRLGVILAYKKDYEGAAQFFEHAISIKSDDPQLLADTALLYHKTHRLHIAKNTIDKAIALSPDNRQIKNLALKINRALTFQKIRERFPYLTPIAITLLCAKYKSKVRRFFRK